LKGLTGRSSRRLVFAAIAAIMLAVAFWGVVTYNRLVRALQDVDAQWAQVESVYQRRADLVPNLVAATQGFLVQERDVIASVVAARASYAGAPPRSPKRVEAANRLDAALGRLLAVIERYPELRSREVVLQLMDELTGTENRIAVERRRYNERVRRYNTIALRFPHALVARLAGFPPRPYFSAAEDASRAPTVR
jgi:LemA protein